MPSSAERRAGEDRANNGTTPRQQKVLFVNICHRYWLFSARGYPREKSPPFFVHYPEYYSGHPCIPATCCVFASGLANNLVPILSSRSPSSWLSCSAGSPKRSWRFGVHFAVPPARNPIYKQKIALKAIFICIYAKIIVSLHPQFHAGDVCASSAGVADILKRRLLRFVLTSEMSQFQPCSGLSNGRCPTGYRLILIVPISGTYFAYMCMRARVP